MCDAKKGSRAAALLLYGEYPMIQDILREIKRQSLHVYQVAVYSEQGLETAQVQDAGSCQPIYSITKVFVNTCIGMLADVKSIRLDDNLLPYLQPYI